jgi:hypothetical protein
VLLAIAKASILKIKDNKNNKTILITPRVIGKLFVLNDASKFVAVFVP